MLHRNPRCGTLSQLKGGAAIMTRQKTLLERAQEEMNRKIEEENRNPSKREDGSLDDLITREIRLDRK
jgi:hypothetical protein